MPGVKKVRYEKKCDECGSPFVASMKNARFCSGACKAKWNRYNEKLAIKLDLFADLGSQNIKWLLKKNVSGGWAVHEQVFAKIIGVNLKELKDRYITDKYEFTRDWMNPGHTEIGYLVKFK